MPSETFYCPSCRAQLTKSAQAYVLGEAAASGGSFIGLGGMADHVTCPACGHAIDAQRMIRGEYDGGAGEMSSFAGIVLGIGGGIGLSYLFAVPWWACLIAGLVIMFSATSYIEKISRRRRT